MAYRKISILLFAMIGLLLGAKVGTHFLLPQTPITQTAAIGPMPATVATSEAIDPAFLQAKAEPVQVAELTVDQSLLLLENYIFPQAEAAASEAEAGTTALVYEDETLTRLREYKGELDLKKSQLDQREKELQEADAQLKQRIIELEQLEASIQQRLTDESNIKSKKIKRLTAVYEGMKPEAAAPVIAKMELATVVKVFLLMDEKKVGKILSFLPPDKAVAISQALTSQISTVK
ncbi:MAG: hypothetical protein CO187_07635 [Zetaproteobacteria bacterium CG_4_9_14_3_um_filter_53_7]|nr:MAG: hypothetical protein CO187_07635 [Zetaproteobacteria bacterium CG_4_9_14_3_um_filter_53_7]